MSEFSHIFQFFTLGLVQGVTEFLPVSSSGHIFLFETIFGLTPSISLEVWLHVASLLAVCGYYWKDIIQLLQEIPKWFTQKDFFKQSMAAKLAISTIFTLPVALLVEKYARIETNLTLVGIMLLFTALLVYFSAKSPSNTKINKETDPSWSIAVLTGLIQGLAVLPGLSRSGITLAFLLFMGISGKKSVKYSFLLSIPTILGAFLLNFEGIDFSLPYIIGFVSSLLTSIVAINWLSGFTRKKWLLFVPYCLVLGFVLVFFPLFD